MDFKDTLLLPKTNFPMRGNLGEKEKQHQARWEEINLYEKNLELNKDNPSFILHDGPPYANGAIHIGHALNKILKDFVVRYKTLQSFYTRYVPGWDTHGLPIESELQKSGIDYKKLSKSQYRTKCEVYAKRQIDLQKEQFKRIGILGEWDNPYITLKPTYEADQLRVFAEMVDKGLIYKGLKPVYWSPSSQSALAEAEILYFDVTSPSIYVSFEVVEGAHMGEKLIIWTTTPWTLPANLAISVHPDIFYVSVKTEKATYILAKSLYEKVMEILGITSYQVINTYKGHTLEYMKYRHPLNNKILPTILGEHVSDIDGTGLVHTAPGHGEDDFNVGKKYNLDVLMPIDDKGFFTKEGLEYEGVFYEKANQLIIEKLNQLGSLLHLSYIKHSYPHDWRTRKPIIFRATPQWFASIEPLKEQLLQAIDNVNWIQKWGKIRIFNMVKDRKDWCISRQRLWGVPIPVFYDEKKEAILDGNLIRHVADIFEQYGSNAWFEKSAKELLPKDYKHPNSPNGIFSKETDIMDVWFDSGTSHSILKRYNLTYPADLYLEGSDQYRGWFNSSITTGVAISGISPYKAVISHGFVLDEENRAMSKSLGNTIDPLVVIKQNGADILRLWVSSVEYSSDVKIGKETIKQATETYRKIRNTLRYMLSVLFDFNHQENAVSFNKLNPLDKVMLMKLELLKKEAYNHYDNYRFDLVVRAVNNYLINDLSAYYLDYNKDTLYVEKKDGDLRRSAQTVIYKHLINILKLLNPILPHTTSEAYWEYNFHEKEDIYLERFSQVKDYQQNELLAAFDYFMELRSLVLVELEHLREKGVIGKSLEAGLNVVVPTRFKNALTLLKVDLAKVLMVAEVNVSLGEKLSVTAFLADGKKCQRCWNIVKSINQDQICPRCARVLQEK